MNDKKENDKITKDMTLAKILEKNPEIGDLLMREGLHCVGCPMSRMETLEQGCKGHGLDPDKIVEKINKKLKEKGE